MDNSQAIAAIIDRLTKNDKAPCKKTLQKIVFLIEAKNVDLGYEYGIHFYGPYSSDLDFAVRQLCDEGILHIDYTPTEHRISVVDDDIEKLDSNLNTNIINTIDEFSHDTPSDLELIATALYAYLILKDLNKAKEGVVKIKGNKYSNGKIDWAIDRLQKAGYALT